MWKCCRLAHDNVTLDDGSHLITITQVSLLLEDVDLLWRLPQIGRLLSNKENFELIPPSSRTRSYSPASEHRHIVSATIWGINDSSKDQGCLLLIQRVRKASTRALIQLLQQRASFTREWFLLFLHLFVEGVVTFSFSVFCFESYLSRSSWLPFCFCSLLW